MAEFDRNAAAVAELERLMRDPQEVFRVAEVAWTYTGVSGDGGWEKLADLLAQGVADEYKLGKVDPRHPTDRSGEAADSVVTGPHHRTVMQWLLVLDHVATLTASESDGGDTFIVVPGQKLREVIRDAVAVVLTQAAAELFRYTESVVDDLEAAWDEAHPDPDPEPEPGAGEKTP